MKNIPQIDSDLLVVALRYIRRGWAVLPLHRPTGNGCSCGKAACAKPGKHPRTRHGLKDATIQESRICCWWARWPDANIGVATGSPSGMLVLDVDDKHDNAGSRSLASLEERHGALPNTLTASTGAGRHLYFRYPGRTVKNSAGALGAGLDIRGDNGYVIAPPSLHANGKIYSWVDSNAPIADLPNWLLSVLCNEGLREAPEHQSEATGAIIRIGTRNDTLARLAGRLRARNMDWAAIEGKLQNANATILEAPLPLGEVQSIAASIARYAPRTPNLPWFPFFTTDWLANDVVRFGCDYQRGWYIQLLVECWRRGGALPDDPNVLWRLAGASSKKAFENDGDHRLVLGEFVRATLENGAHVLIHPWMTDHFEKQSRKYQQKCEAGRRSAAKRAMGQDTLGVGEQANDVPLPNDRTNDRLCNQNQIRIQN